MTETYKKKLIEVAIPLEAINAASAREKSIRHGHPSTLHLWWARRPLAACRAVLFAQLVDDPSSHPDKFPTEEAVEIERKRLFKIIEDLVIWENSTNEEVLERARAEIRKCCDGELPPVYDPFSGGGSIPLEAQRLGLPAYGSDLNPVAVMIGKAMIEIPPKFKDQEPIHPGGKERNHYRNAEGLAEDVKYYGEWMREKAFERIGHLYPQVELPSEYGGGKATVIAWIWARTVPSPDPAFSDVQVPLASSYLLSSKSGREAWVRPVVDRNSKTIRFQICKNGPKAEIAAAKTGSKLGRGANFRCEISGSAITPEYIKSKASAGQIGRAMLAIVADGGGRRVYLSPTDKHLEIANAANTEWKPELEISADRRAFTPPDYGMPTFGDLFTPRQRVALETFILLIREVRSVIDFDASQERASDGNVSLSSRGSGSRAYAEALSIYLAFAIDRFANRASTICMWNSIGEKIEQTFARPALPITWQFAEGNPFSNSTGDWTGGAISWIVKAIELLPVVAQGEVSQSDAQNLVVPSLAVLATDPPYYDNIPYADLSDFFYCLLRPVIAEVYPSLAGVLATPKSEELVAAPHRQGGRREAETFFLSNMGQAIENLVAQLGNEYPITIFYAFKQREIEQEGVSSTGWATFLQALIEAGLEVVGTWPMRTERSTGLKASQNALAGAVLLVCRARGKVSEVTSRANFVRELKQALPSAIAQLQAANIAPADMPQSAIGPGMGIFSQFGSVLEADDKPMTVKTALQLINRELDEFLNDIQGEFDADTRFAITWFEQNGKKAGDYGTANNLATARGISVDSVKHAGIVESSAGKVRILKRNELIEDWDPLTDSHLTIWECLQYLVREHEQNGISYDAALLLKKMEDKVEAIKDLAYCLYDICANKRQDAKEATAYNALIADWTELTRQAAAIHDVSGERQAALDL